MGFWVNTIDGLPSVEATVEYQVDDNRGYCRTVKSEVFDCTGALDEIAYGELPAEAEGFRSDGACDYGDDVYRNAVALGVVDGWDGPFEVYVDRAGYARYHSARGRLEMRRAAIDPPSAKRHV